jgi:uncharacterized protein (DUF1697 family)
MKTYIALFRGINVGGNSILPMKDLVALLEDMGFKNIKTHIQSGNAVFQYNGQDSDSQLSGSIGAEINKRFGFEPKVLLLALEEMKKAIGSNPFPEAAAEPKTLHLGFLDGVPANPDVKALENLKKVNERFCLEGRLFYLLAPDGVGRSKLAAKAEGLLGVAMTSRNWRTVSKVLEIADSIDSNTRPAV